MKIIIDGHVEIAKETCRVIGRGIQILTTEVIPAIETDTLDYRFGEHVESSDDFVGVHPEHNFQIVQVRGAFPGGSTGDSTGRLELHQGARLESSTGGVVWGLYVARTRLVFQGV